MPLKHFRTKKEEEVRQLGNKFTRIQTSSFNVISEETFQSRQAVHVIKSFST